MRGRPASDRFITGFLAGLLLPLVVFFVVYLFTGDGMSLKEYTERILSRNILSHTISLCVFPNIVIFLIFNRSDRLISARGVLGVTILWAIAVFAVKLF
ncbi:MAG: hypothetical protein U5K32_10290 [Bacteroidales bacterium]|nr:hypothetical protein [Bacteroidales bacterium]